MEENKFGFDENAYDINGKENENGKENDTKVDSSDFVPIEKVDDVKVEEQVEEKVEEPVQIASAPKAQTYYTESYKKPKEKKTTLFQLILVSLFSAIFGAGVFFAATQFVTPILNGESTKVDLTGDASNSNVQKIVNITESESTVSAIAEKVGPSIVGIKVTIPNSGQNFFFGEGSSDEDSTGEGSGIIISEDGYILTNYHVVSDALESNTNTLTSGAKIEVILPSQQEKTYTATVVGKDSKSDIAVIKINATGLPAAELGDSSTLKVGELAVAIGNPGGLDYMGSVTQGCISGLNRSIQLENGSKLNLIQTDAAINPGNSGGALCNSAGQVIGINTVKISATGYEGLGFAIPINHAKEIAQNLIDYKYIKGRPYLGVSIDNRLTEEAAKQYNVPMGALVYEVTTLSSAYKAGIQAGDIITKFDGVTINGYDALETQKNKHKPGDKVEIEVYRDGKTIKLTATLDEDKS